MDIRAFIQKEKALEDYQGDDRVVSSIELKRLLEEEGRREAHRYFCGMPMLDGLMAGFRPGNLVVIGGFPGEGKCFGKGTKVLMYDGRIKKVEDVRVGDRLMGPDSKPRVVLKLGTGVDELYRIHQTKGDSYTVNGDHILVLRLSGTNKEKEITVKEHRTQNISERWKGFAVPVEYPARKVEIDPYFLGVWLGDGHTPNIRITSADVEIEDWLRGYVKKLGLKLRKTPYKKYKNKKPNAASIFSITKKKRGIGYSLQGHLRSIGLLGNKHIPHEYLANSRKVRLELLAGLIDTDGYTNHEGYVFVNKNEGLARSFQQLAQSLGFRAHLTKFLNKEYGRYYFKVGICGDCSVIPVRIKRKKVKSRSQIKNVLNTGIRIEPMGRGRYYGFQVDRDGRFLLGDCTVTHNSTLGRTLTRKFLQNGTHCLWFQFEETEEEFLSWFEGEKEMPEFFIPKSIKEKTINWITDRVIESRVSRHLPEDKRPKVVFIDNLEAIKNTAVYRQYRGGVGINEASLYGLIVQQIKNLAVDLNLVFFLMSNTNRSESRGRQAIPDDTSYVGSQQIAHCADSCWSIWRKKTKPKSWEEVGGMTDEAIVLISKNRGKGRKTGVVKLKYKDGVFEELDEVAEKLRELKEKEDER